jgi:hypothetical protein
MELRIEIYNSGRFGGQKDIFRRFWEYLWNFLVDESFGVKE